MDVLCEWYKTSCETMQQQLTPAKKQQDLVRRPPVVIVVEDFEAFSPSVLQDLITSISPHLPELPVVLVLGVATSLHAVHTSLSRSASSLLCIEVFHTQHSILTMQQILQETLMDVPPFKLGSKAMQFLLQQFFYCNFSLINLTSALKFAVMEHFYWQPLSVLLSYQCEGGNQTLKLTHGQCEAVRATPSFQRYVESQEAEQQVELLENNHKLKSVVSSFLGKLNGYHKRFFPHLECLHILTRDMPSKPLGSKKYELYLLSLEQNLVDHPKFKEAWSVVKMMSNDDLTENVRKCLQYLESEPDTCLDQFKSLLSQLITQKETQHVEMETTPMTTSLPVTETTSERKMRFQEHLRQAKSRKREPTAIEVQRNRTLDSLLENFKECLVCPDSMVLHEVMYFDNVSSMRKQLAPAPRASLQTALSNPHYYLPSVGCMTEASGLDQNMPDVCVVYQLHLECGRLINLYDWLQAFITVITPAAEKKTDRERTGKNAVKKSSSKQEVDPVLHARFIQAVSELQFLGFIKPTQRKTDHVQRLTWGAC